MLRLNDAPDAPFTITQGNKGIGIELDLGILGCDRCLVFAVCDAFDLRSVQIRRESTGYPIRIGKSNIEF
ncbi:hypothetical protein D3C87_1864870 [compost metagenome]